MCKGAVFACGHADIAYISHTVGQHATGARATRVSRLSKVRVPAVRRAERGQSPIESMKVQIATTVLGVASTVL